MATPVKNITYLPGVQALAAPILKPSPMALAPRNAVVMRLLPRLWKPLYYRAVQTRGATVLPPRPLYLQARIAVKMTLFWRNAPRSEDHRPIEGQIAPRLEKLTR